MFTFYYLPIIFIYIDSRVECMRKHTTHNTQCTIDRVMSRVLVYWFAQPRTRLNTLFNTSNSRCENINFLIQK